MYQNRPRQVERLGHGCRIPDVHQENAVLMHHLFPTDTFIGRRLRLRLRLRVRRRR